MRCDIQYEWAASKSIAIVTGAASGIGKAIAVTLAQEGKHVVVVDLDKTRGEVVAKEVGGHFVHANLSKRADCRRVVEEALGAFGGLQILVNNAGYQHLEKLEDFPEDRWEDMIAVMLTAPFLLTKYSWPTMKAQHFGRIVNIASIHGLVASSFKCAYVAAKHGLLGLTKVAALEGADYGITVNAICPAYARTPIVENQIEDQSRLLGFAPEEVVQRIMLEPAPIKRLIEPREIASLVSYLCSENASAVTGASWTIDLGWTAR